MQHNINKNIKEEVKIKENYLKKILGANKKK